MVGMQNLRGLGTTLLTEYRETMQLARATDGTPADRDARTGEVEFTRDGVQIRADFHREESITRLSMTQEAPEPGLKSSSVSFEDLPHSDKINVTMFQESNGADRHRTQVNILVNKNTGTITELTTTEWNPADIP